MLNFTYEKVKNILLRVFFRYTFIVVFGIIIVQNMLSCKTRQKLVYLQTNEIDSTNFINSRTFGFNFKVDDIVAISISGSDLELIKPFISPNAFSLNGQDGYENGSASKDGYLIDNNGEINFPVLGKIKIGGMTRSEAIDLLTTKLKEYINNPIVNIRVTNFKITVLGSVQHPGTFLIPNERITIFEALGLSKDTKITGVRKNVLVVRDINNSKSMYRIDLTSDAIFMSPVYYLQQNDVVYVEPNKLERFSSTIFKSSTGVFISLVTVIITAFNIILNQ
jgi:polysaccharide export outer membrane protein